MFFYFQENFELKMSSKERLYSFYSIEEETVSELTVKGSKFIAHAAPSATKEIAEEYISQISKKFHDATHNCYAYKIGVGERCYFRFYDAGEPSGTAGKPIFQAIEAKKLTNVVIAVTRYFGGTKLGTGGLIRAYNSLALAVLNKAVIVKIFPQITLGLIFAYHHTHAVQQVLRKYHAQTLQSRFEEKIEYLVKLKAREETAFRNDLNNLTSGEITIEWIDVNSIN